MHKRGPAKTFRNHPMGQNILMVVGASILLLWMGSCVKSCFTGGDKPKGESGSRPRAPAQVVKVVRVGKEKRSFRFSSSPTGCVSTIMPSSWEHYVFGGTGAITIQHPNGQLDNVPPGGDWRPRGQLIVGPDKVYTFCRQTPTSADSIVIWAEWGP